MQNSHPINDSLIMKKAMPLLIIGAAGLALTFGLGGSAFGRSYLFGYVFWATLSLGCLGVLILHNVIRASWALPIQRMLEAGSKNIVLMAALFVPIIALLTSIYIWADPVKSAGDAIIQQKQLYLNPAFFILRNALYFAIWISIAAFLSKWSLKQDETAELRYQTLRTNLAAPGIVMYVLTLTFAVVDWVMSLEPHWFSTIFGILFLSGQLLTTTAFCTALLILYSKYAPYKSRLTIRHFHDLGLLLFAFTMFWAYISFSQILIIWSGNLPEETTYYVSRLNGGWQWFAIGLVVFQFFLPFLLLLSANTKSKPERVWTIVWVILIMRVVEMAWLILPAFYPSALTIQWTDITAFVSIGCIWLWSFLRILHSNPLLPTYDPRLKEVAEDVA